jgi:PAS domain S-box-containing protein
MLNLEILKQAVMDSRDGITISDNCAEDNPLIFVNPAFERLTGYSFEEITNVNCRYLQNNDRDQPELEIIHKAIEEGEYCLVTLRNYRKDGTMFWNELSISPIYNEKWIVTHFLGIQKDVTSRVLIEQQLREENQSLEKIKAHFEQLSIKDGEEFVVLSAGMTKEQAASFAEKLCQQVRSLGIPHSASSTGYLTVSIGFSVHLLASQDAPGMLLEQADKALYVAKKLGRNQSFSIC